jgi:superfamily II DNA/RNA helicase
MSPTRELSAQIKSVVDALAINISSFKSQLLVGGTDLDNDIINLKDNQPHVIIGCPGRIYDILRRKYINLELVKLLILDEADEMLSTGFKEQVYNIFNLLPSNIQKALFSASMPNTIDDLINKFVTDPIKIVVKSEQLTLDGIKQYFVNLENDTMKYETLKDLFSTFSVAQCIIYCNSVTRVSELYDAMNSDGYPVCQIHSSLDKMTRQQNYDDFRRGKFRVLISSNVTARGIDIQQVSTVINFDVPKCIHSYLHRIGRSGRWGRKGVAINFITRRDYKQLKEIESFYQTNISELPEDYK